MDGAGSCDQTPSILAIAQERLLTGPFGAAHNADACAHVPRRTKNKTDPDPDQNQRSGAPPNAHQSALHVAAMQRDEREHAVGLP